MSMKTLDWHVVNSCILCWVKKLITLCGLPVAHKTDISQSGSCYSFQFSFAQLTTWGRQSNLPIFVAPAKTVSGKDCQISYDWEEESSQVFWSYFYVHWMPHCLVDQTLVSKIPLQVLTINLLWVTAKRHSATNFRSYVTTKNKCWVHVFTSSDFSESLPAFKYMLLTPCS